VIASLTIALASLCGYIGAPVWVIALAALGLAALSRGQHEPTLKLARGLGYRAEVRQAMFTSAINALIAGGAAYGLGLVVRTVSGL
jgi:hypothetical protein